MASNAMASNASAEGFGPAGGDLVAAKVTAMAVLGLVSLLVGLVPIKLAVWLRWAPPPGAPHSAKASQDGSPGPGSGSGPAGDSAALSLLLCAGGGVLLCTTLAQLLPEVRVQLVQLHHMHYWVPAPAAELLMAGGFFAMYLVEELVHLHLHRNKQHSEEDGSGQHAHRHGHGHAHGHAHDQGALGTAARGLLVVLGLSVHELIEGLAVGLERSAPRVWVLFIAVASHKFVISFCVGVQLVAMGSRPAFVCAYVGTFSFMSALGIGLGMAATASQSVASGVTATLLQGVAAGTLLYVVFFEVLEPQRASRHAGIRQLLAVMAGFGAMLFIQFAVQAMSE